MKRVMGPGLALLLGTAGAAQAQSMGQEYWAARVREVMPAALCQPGGYFRECFEQSAQACLGAANAAVDACLKQHDAQMPLAFRGPEESGRWGQVIAACAGNRFEAGVRALKKRTPRCNDPGAWR